MVYPSNVFSEKTGLKKQVLKSCIYFRRVIIRCIRLKGTCLFFLDEEPTQKLIDTYIFDQNMNFTNFGKPCRFWFSCKISMFSK